MSGIVKKSSGQIDMLNGPLLGKILLAPWTPSKPKRIIASAAIPVGKKHCPKVVVGAHPACKKVIPTSRAHMGNTDPMVN